MADLVGKILLKASDIIEHPGQTMSNIIRFFFTTTLGNILGVLLIIVIALRLRKRLGEDKFDNMVSDVGDAGKEVNDILDDVLNQFK